MHRSRIGLAGGIVIVLTLGPPFHSSASAQRGAQIAISDDGEQRDVAMFSLPDLQALRTPDFTRADLPVFTKFLLLSTPQEQWVGQLIDEYLERFAELQQRHLAASGLVAPQTGEHDGSPPQEPPSVAIMLPGMESPQELGLEKLRGQLPPGTTVQVAVQVSMAAPGDPGRGPAMSGDDEPAEPVPAAQVSVNVDTPDGEDISEELRARILEQAQKVANSIEARFREQVQQGSGMGAMGHRDGAPPPAMADLRERAEAVRAALDGFTKARQELRRWFDAEARNVLAEEQLSLWPRLERALTRARTLSVGRIAGERVDLLLIMDALKLSQSQIDEVSELVDAYELALDAALRQRDAVLAEAGARNDRLIHERRFDDALALADRVRGARIAVRSVNEQFTESLAHALPDPLGPELRSRALGKGYPSVYRQTAAQRVLAAAEELAGLDAPVHRAIVELVQAYERERAAVDQQIRQAIDRHQPLEPRQEIERLKGAMAGDDSGAPDRLDERERSPIKAAFRRRMDLDEQYDRQVRQLLEPDLLSKLPPSPRRAAGPIVISTGESAPR